MDELADFLTRMPYTKCARDLLMKVKSSSKLSLKDMRDLFDSLPRNFINSFMRHQNRKGINLPSSAFKPLLNPCGLFYDDLPMVRA
jgi:hypothetical protein